jgi:hypothetical protein
MCEYAKINANMKKIIKLLFDVSKIKMSEAGKGNA